MSLGNAHASLWTYVHVEGNRKCFPTRILNGFIGSYADVLIKNFKGRY